MGKAQATPRKRKVVGKHRRRSLQGIVIFVMLLACLVFSASLVYPTARGWYLSDREVGQLSGELAAIEARNDQIDSQTKVLETPEGIQDRAREQLGMVMNGEAAVNITGLALTTSSTALPAEVPRGLLLQEEGWWADFCDSFFAVPKPSEPIKLDDPFQSSD